MTCPMRETFGGPNVPLSLTVACMACPVLVHPISTSFSPSTRSQTTFVPLFLLPSYNTERPLPVSPFFPTLVYTADACYGRG